MINYIFCVSNIFFKRVLQILNNHFFKEKFFYINQTKNFFSYVLKSVFISIKLLKSAADAANKNVTKCILYKVCKKDSDCRACREDEEEDKREKKKRL